MQVSSAASKLHKSRHPHWLSTSALATRASSAGSSPSAESCSLVFAFPGFWRRKEERVGGNQS
jgi:hypothetical protein